MSHPPDRLEYWKKYHQTPAYKERNAARMRTAENREARKFSQLSIRRKRKILENRI